MKMKPVIIMATVMLVVGLPRALAAGAPEEETWDLPQTGQQNSYAHTGSDGDLEMGVEWDDSSRFNAVTPQVLIDNLTGLMWAKELVTTPLAWNQAIDYANQSTYGDFTDWRLPNVRELRSLLHYGQATTSWLSSRGFLNLISGRYWTSTTLYLDTGYAWYVELDQGLSGTSRKTSSSYYVLLVR